ncbi:hypothetical protein HCJ39_09090 [Listeria rocourtiae]|uniref:hypothetical protein n=1 Tax=Listeria rocourtiae TaxID=647910 RepID=UPI00162709A5|nr:hypothetical protein [Listeria rocourtiae]MBC1604865.1 hypothetical protein [Listeria rocourtiae]
MPRSWHEEAGQKEVLNMPVSSERNWNRRSKILQLDFKEAVKLPRSWHEKAGQKEVLNTSV